MRVTSRSLRLLQERYKALQEQFNDAPQVNYKDIVGSYQEKLKSFPMTHSCLLNCYSESDLRFLCRYNLFFLISCAFNRSYLLTEWTHARCVECQRQPNGYLQLWAREHHKSSIWTIGKTIQDILASHGEPEALEDLTPRLVESIYLYLGFKESVSLEEKFNKIKSFDFKEEVVVGIFSATKTLAEAFLSEIKRELETNDLLITLFPDVLYRNPAKNSDKWSIQNGICVKRKTVRKESTVEAWGLVVGQPTSKHFTICIFDDIVTHDLVKTLYMNQIVINSWENAFSLGSSNGAYRAVGTRKHFSAPYSNMIERKAFVPIIYTPYDENNRPVLMSADELEDRRNKMGETTYAAEYLQEPLKNSALGLRVENVGTHNVKDTTNLCLYMFCDPAKSKKKNSDYSVFLVLGIDADRNVLLVDGVRDRLSLSEKWEELYKLYKKYPAIRGIYYEEFGAISDTQYFEEKMNECAHFFANKFQELSPKVSRETKSDRIAKIQPYLDQKKILFPAELKKQTKDFMVYDLVDIFKWQEIAKYPYPEHDDLLDCLAYCIIFLQNGLLKSVQDDEDTLQNINGLIEDAYRQEEFLINV